MTDLSKRVLLAALLTAAADLCLFGHEPGAGLAAFALLLLGVAARRHGRRLARAGRWGFLWCLLAAGAALEPSVTGALLLVLLGWTALARVARPDATPLDALLGGLEGGLSSALAAPADLRRAARARSARTGRRLAPAWVYLVPLGIAFVFALLLLPANPVLVRWVRDAFDALALDRLLFWIALFLLLYGAQRFRSWRPPSFATDPRPAGADRAAQELRACVLTLLLLNALFLAGNVADVLYLWVRFELPEGLTYSAYAHRGAYRLAVAVVLAAVTVEAFFRRGTRQAEERAPRALAALLVAQNLLVLAGAARRLALYAEAYGLTRFRVAAVLWLALVACGLVLVLVRIRRARPLRFLLEKNATATVLALSLWALADVDGFVAAWNVRRYLAEPARGVDVAYLDRLAPASLPALARLSREGGDDVRPAAGAALRRRLEEARGANRAWASWSWRRAASVRRADGILAPP